MGRKIDLLEARQIPEVRPSGCYERTSSRGIHAGEGDQRQHRDHHEDHDHFDRRHSSLVSRFQPRPHSPSNLFEWQSNLLR